MTPKERDEWWADLIACTITGLLLVFVLIVHKVAFSYSNQSTSTDYLPEQVRMLGLGCPACHLVKQPPSECGEFVDTTWLWLECTAMEHRYPNE